MSRHDARRALLALMLLAGAPIVGCTPKVEVGGQCLFNDDCEGSLICAGGICRAQCRTDEDCDGDTHCSSPGVVGPNVCLMADSEALCVDGRVCPAGARCVSRGIFGGACRWTCGGDTECGVRGRGACNNFTQTCAGFVLASELPSWPTNDAGDAAVDASGDATADAPGDIATGDAPSDIATGDAADAACAAGFEDCDNDPTNGCEADTRASPRHCGGCGRSCSGANHVAVGTCAAGRCGVGMCVGTWRDCDRDPANGCEVNTAESDAHCGGCGSACGAGTQACAAGACVDLRFPVPTSVAVESAFEPSADAGVVTISSGQHRYRSVRIPAGVTVRTNNTGVLEVWSEGDVVIDGTIDLTGGVGGSVGGQRYSPGGGGVTGSPQAGVDGVAMSAACPAPAGGGWRGYAGGSAPGVALCGLGGSFGGGAGGAVNYGGGGGGGVAGGGGGSGATTAGEFRRGGAGSGADAGAPVDGSAMQGGTGGARELGAAAGLGAYAGSDGSEPCESVLGASGGGGSIGRAAAEDLALTSAANTFYPGSGGGGGGGAGPYTTGAGGGGGGGALRVVSATRITLGASARVLADGGAGGAGRTAPGGGGAGGVVALYAPVVSVESGSRVSAVGGAGGTYTVAGCTQSGGAGGLGRIRIWTRCADARLYGTMSPPFRACVSSDTAPVAGDAYVANYP